MAAMRRSFSVSDFRTNPDKYDAIEFDNCLKHREPEEIALGRYYKAKAANQFLLKQYLDQAESEGNVSHQMLESTRPADPVDPTSCGKAHFSSNRNCIMKFFLQGCT